MARRSQPDTHYVGFTQDAGTHLAALRNLFPYPEKLRLFTVRHTAAELARLNDEVFDAKPELADDGINVNAVRTDVRSNVVEILISPRSTQAIAALEERFGANRTRIVGATVEIDLL